MAYQKTTWTDRVVQYPHRYKDQNNNQLTLTADAGTVTSAGTLITAGALNKIETELESIDGSPDRSAVQSAYDAVLSMPASTKNGLVRGTLSGMTLNNAVVNGDFSGGTTGWTGSSSTLSASNKILTAIGTGTSVYVSTLQTLGTVRQPNKYFFMARARVTNSVCQAIHFRLVFGGGTSITLGQVSSPAINTWVEVKGILTATDQTGAIQMYLRSQYADSATANGKVMEVDGNSGVFAIDMTALGLDSLTESQMKDLCNNGYFEGLKGSDVEVQTVGKNLFNSNNILFGSGLNTGTGLPQASTVSSTSSYIKVKQNLSYTISGRSDDAVTRTVVFYNSNYEILSISTASTPTVNITTPSNCVYIRFSFQQTKLQTTQLELGTTATAYSQYAQSILSLDKPLNRVPSGVADTHALDTGALTQNVSDVYTLVAGDIGTLATGNINNDIITIAGTTISAIKDYGTADNVATKLYTDKTQPRNNVGFDTTENVWRHSITTNAWYVFVPKGTYANLAAAQAALAGTKILYQLATPVTTDYNRSLLSFENGTLYDNGLLPTYKQVTTPTNVAGNLEDSIVIDAMFSEMIGDLDDSTTVNKTSVIGITNEILASNPLKFYGKYSLATGGSAVSASGSNVSGYVSYSVESKDDFNAINIAGAPTKITIPSGVTLARFYFNGQVNTSNGVGTSAQVVVSLYKNGVLYDEFAYSRTSSNGTTSNSDGNISFGWTEPIPCVAGNYFEIYVVCTSPATTTASLSANSKFGMEVLG